MTPYSRPLPSLRHGYAFGLFAAVGIHAAILFGFRPDVALTPPQYAMEAVPSGVEVALVASAPAGDDAPESPPSQPEQIEAEPVEPAPTLPPPPPESPESPDPTPQPTPEPAPPSPDSLARAPAPDATPAPPPTPAPVHHASVPRRSNPRRLNPPRPAIHPGGGSATPGDESLPSGTAGAVAGHGLASPGYLRNPQPPYPEEARRQKEEGVVLLKVEVDARGRVLSVLVARSSGHPALDESARGTVEARWRFNPARRGATPVSATVTVPIRFTLGG